MAPRISQPKNISLFDKVLMLCRFSVSQIVTFGFFLLPVLPIDIFFLKNITPSFFLIPVFYWSIFRPNVLPPALIFIYGITLDIFGGEVLGFYPLIYIGIQAFIKVQRRMLLKQSFLTIWGGFVIVTSFYTVIEVLMLLIFSDFTFAPFQAFLSFVTLILLYPLFSPLMILAHRLVSVAPTTSKSL